MSIISISGLLNAACSARETFFDSSHQSAFRLFNGFLEGLPALSIDIYGHTALIHNYATNPLENPSDDAKNWILEKLPWVECILQKTRGATSRAQKNGWLLHGSKPDHKILEHGLWYAIDLTLNRDASFYMDTRNLRHWAQANLAGKTVLNTFAYTGSLGIAALGGGAARCIQLDRNPDFLKIAKTSYSLNGFPIAKNDFICEDFFVAVSQFKRQGQSFDCIFLDPPFFAVTPKGVVNLETGSARLINKIRPLVNDGGWIVSINNALYTSGEHYLALLKGLCAGGYLDLEALIPVAADFTGFPETRAGSPPIDPAPFNHSTKIAILRVRRKPVVDKIDLHS